MLTKTLYVIIDLIAIADLFVLIRAFSKVKAEYGRWIIRTFIAAVVAIFANMLLALSISPSSAEVAYCLYFASIDWVIYFLSGFCLLYTEHGRTWRKLDIPIACIMGADSLSLFANLLFGHSFSVYGKAAQGTIFFQTAFHPAYYVHLILDYSLILLAFIMIVYRIARSRGIYRAKYVIILGVLLIVLVMNLVYMARSLLLDASVIFYAVAGALIYFCTEILVPRGLIRTAVTRAADDMSEGLILFDISNNLIYANAFARYRFDLEPRSGDLTGEPMAYVTAELKKQGKQFGEVLYVKNTMSGTEHYKIRYTSLTDKKLHTIGSYFLIQDTTEEVFYLHEIEEARINADNANQAKSTFLANMSHEIRTPLNSVLGMNEMILRTSDDPQIREYAENVRDSGDTLLSLINDILDFSKIEAGRMEIVKKEYDPQKLVRDCYHFFDQPARSKGLFLDIDFDKAIPRRLIGDMLHIKQILTNIISNAVKYTFDGGITVSLSFRKTGRDSIDLKMEVRDTGMGIERKDIAVLFDAFKRVNEKENAAIQGTGLGLAITKQLVDMMEGEIIVDSTPGKGSTFTVVIPQQVGDANHSGSLILQEKEEESDYKESFRAPDARILIVDDVALNLKVAVALLKKTLLQIDGAGSGDEAIELCRKRKYDLILLDHRMPRKDGVETFREISEAGLNTETPVVMITANALHGAEEEYRKLGFSGYLSKPVDVKALEETIVRLLPEEKVIKL